MALMPVVWLDCERSERLSLRAAPSTTADELGVLHQRRCHVICTDGELAVRIWSAEPVADWQISGVPKATAVASLVQEYRGALLILERPAATFGVERIGFAAGMQALLLEDPSDGDCWHSAWRQGAPCWGLAGQLRIDTGTAKPEPVAVLTALRFGHVVAGVAAALEDYRESPTGMAWSLQHDGLARVLGPDDFVLAAFEGRSGRWNDRDGTNRVRMQWLVDGQEAWSQPRLLQGFGRG